METIGISELKTHAGAIVRRVRDQREPVDVTIRGRIVARIVPVEDASIDKEAFRAAWAKMDELAAKIGAVWPPGVSALEAVREGRREL